MSEAQRLINFEEAREFALEIGIPLENHRRIATSWRRLAGWIRLIDSGEVHKGSYKDVRPWSFNVDDLITAVRKARDVAARPGVDVPGFTRVNGNFLIQLANHLGAEPPIEPLL